MLTELHVEDLGIVAGLTVPVGAGLTAITGETGAGKTLLIDAIELLVGGRADTGLVRDGAAEGRVHGRFVDPATDEEVVLARVVPVDGRSRAYVDGRPVSAAELAEHGARLVDLHGQHTHQSLLAPNVQRAALDRFAGPAAADALGEYRGARAEVRALAEELAGLGGDGRARARELDLLRFQLEELAAAAIHGADEDDELRAAEELLAAAVEHREALGEAYRQVHGPALDAVGGATALLAGREPFAPLADRLRALEAELAEVAHDLRDAEEAVVDDPERLEAVRERRRLLRDLRRKYGDSLADVITFEAQTRERADTLAGYEERAAGLEARTAAMAAAARAAGERLSAVRQAAAPDLAAAVVGHLRELALPGARVEVMVEPAEATEDGLDRVTFLLAANAGEPPRPLARAASGGELARTMLALRLVLSGAPSTLVFDEVDAGIGGEAGAAVGRKLAALAASHQVLCVTHLPQVAAFADRQVVVSKRRSGGRTVAGATPVEGPERVAELSRMLAGVGESDHARRHAEELLAVAAADRASRGS